MMITEDEYYGLIRDGVMARIGVDAWGVFSCICFCGHLSSEEIAKRVGISKDRVERSVEALVEHGLSKWWD